MGRNRRPRRRRPPTKRSGLPELRRQAGLRGRQAWTDRTARDPDHLGTPPATWSGTWKATSNTSASTRRRPTRSTRACGATRSSTCSTASSRSPTDLPGARLRPVQHHLHRGRYRLDRRRPADLRRDRQGRIRLVTKNLGEKPVVAVIYSHSHVDHYGGVRGIVDEADVQAGKVQSRARRLHRAGDQRERHCRQRHVTPAIYMYGALLPRNPQGGVNGGLGQTTRPAPPPDHADGHHHHDGSESSSTA